MGPTLPPRNWVIIWAAASGWTTSTSPAADEVAPTVGSVNVCSSEPEKAWYRSARANRSFGGEPVVLAEVVDHRGEQGVEPERVVGGLGLVQGGRDDQVLPLDPTDVRGGIGVPLAVGVVLEVARPRQGQGLGSVEHLAAGGRDVEPGVVVADAGRAVLVAHRVREVHGDAPERVDGVLQAEEADHDVVADRDPEGVLDGLDQGVGAAAERRVDLVGAGQLAAGRAGRRG